MMVMTPLHNRRVLIAEDDFHLAWDLARCFAEAGAEILGPTPRLGRAERLAPFAEAAVLDLNLRGELVFRLADGLKCHGVPFVFYSASDEIEVPLRFRSVDRLREPNEAVAMVQRHLLAATGDDVVDLLPKLRLMARLIYNDADIADRMVERCLRLAITRQSDKAPTEATEDWLSALLFEVAGTSGRTLLN